MQAVNLNEERNEDNRKIMVYMGSYVKDRPHGKYNDYVTYDGNLKASYKSYMDLNTGEVYNIEIDKCEEFESSNYVARRSVSVYSFDSYLSNYYNLRKLYLQQLESGKEQEEVKLQILKPIK